MLKINDSIEIPLGEFDFTFARSSGPGGQNVNKVETKAILYWDLNKSSLRSDVKSRFLEKFHSRITTEGVLVLNSDRFRDKSRNISDCFDRVKTMVTEVAVPPKKRRPTKPSRAANQKRIDQKKQQGQKKDRRGKVDY